MHITCRELIDFLDDYVSGEMSPVRREKVDEHLAACPECVNYLDSYRKTISLCKSAEIPAEQSAPTDVPQELLKAILAARPTK